jgi:hypothetical protein
LSFFKHLSHRAQTQVFSFFILYTNLTWQKENV